MIRCIEINDYYTGLLDCLSALHETELEYTDFLDILKERDLSQITTLVSVIDDKIVGTASFFIEKKFLHGGSKCCYIEDVAVTPSCQQHGVGKAIVGHILELAKNIGCYKACLSCSDENVPFYNRCGFHISQNNMKKFLDN